MIVNSSYFAVIDNHIFNFLNKKYFTNKITIFNTDKSQETLA